MVVRGVDRFEIHLDDNRTLFLPGQKIEGHVALKMDDELVVTTLKIRFTGKVITYLQKDNVG